MGIIRISLSEKDFRLLNDCGSIPYTAKSLQMDLSLSKSEIFDLAEGDVVSKQVEGMDFEIALQDIGLGLIDKILSGN